MVCISLSRLIIRFNPVIALLGLLRSIAPDAVPEEGKKLREDDVKKINERLTELLGKDAVEHYNKDENARGEVRFTSCAITR
jgi:hypothetical protein